MDFRVIRIQFEIRHKPGKYHGDASAMSRHFEGENDDGTCKEAVDFHEHENYCKEVYFLKQVEDELEKIGNCLIDGKIPESVAASEIQKFKDRCSKYKLYESRLFCRNSDGIARRVIINKIKAENIPRIFHDSACVHFGIENTAKKILLRYW
jgi:hypothetical protein